MIGKLICWLLGHKRGKRIAEATGDAYAEFHVLAGNAVFECPRCHRRWARPAKKVARKDDNPNATRFEGQA